MARPAFLTAAPAAAPDAARAADDWFRWLADEKRTADLTLEAYRRDLNAFFSFVRDHRGEPPGLAVLADLRTADFRAWLASRADPRDPYARTSTARALSAVRGFFRFLDKRGLAHNPAIGGVRSPKLPHSIPKPLTVPETGDLLDLVATEARLPWVAARDLAVLTLLYGCGLRIASRRSRPSA
ncbi:MAG: site-specific integrase, partial [Bauldia litoralis]